MIGKGTPIEFGGFWLISLLVLVIWPLSVLGEGARVETSEAGVARVAPGETLPVSVRLVNFGHERRADVTVEYRIEDLNGNVILQQKETVAVETTASFVKQISLPPYISPGSYNAITSLNYSYQEVPAVSWFTFTVEPKWFGFFRSDFLWNLVWAALLALFTVTVLHVVLAHRERRRIITHDYTGKPKEERIYYEIISDTVQQMRLRAGDDALTIAAGIPGLKVDINTGKVSKIDGGPAEIIALLVLRYETLLGHRVALAARKNGIDDESVASLNKDLATVKKYFN